VQTTLHMQGKSGMTSKSALMLLGIWGGSPRSTQFGPQRVHTPNGISVDSVVLAQLTLVTNRQTHREKFIHHKANNQCYRQNELMWQAAREEIPI